MERAKKAALYAVKEIAKLDPIDDRNRFILSLACDLARKLGAKTDDLNDQINMAAGEAEALEAACWAKDEVGAMICRANVAVVRSANELASKLKRLEGQLSVLKKYGYDEG